MTKVYTELASEVGTELIKNAFDTLLTSDNYKQLSKLVDAVVTLKSTKSEID